MGEVWQLDSVGKITISQDLDDEDFSVLGSTGGSKTHTQTLEELARHNHISYPGGAITNSKQELGAVVAALSNSGETSYTGESKPMDIMNPYIVVKRWHRTA